jgi:superoxide reductase
MSTNASPLSSTYLKRSEPMELNQLYKCASCGGVYEVAVKCNCEGPCAPSCCGEETKLLVENSVDAAKEKHVPVITKVDGGYKVAVGAVAHPMTPEHWIAVIELIADGQVLRQTLTPTDKPEAVFLTKATKVKAREYCNLHGLWIAEA